MAANNYIHTLQGQRVDLLEAIVDAQCAANELLAYLESPKFFNDTTVQIKDVMARLEPVRDALIRGLHASDNFRKGASK